MPYTDAIPNDDEGVWHVYRDEDVPDTNPSTHHVARSACGGRMVGTGKLFHTRKHARDKFFDSLKPPTLADWLAHPKVCEVCAEEVGRELGIYGNVRLARRDHGGQE